MKNSFVPNNISLSLLFITFSTLLLISCGPKPEEMSQYYDTGEVSRTYIMVNGKKEGKMVDFYKDGKIKGERMFENDVEVGKSTYYYPTGEIKETQYHVDGKINGGDTVFYENGKPQFVRTFNKGVLEGYIRKWDADGMLIYEAKYAGDSLVEVKGMPLYPDTLEVK